MLLTAAPEGMVKTDADLSVISDDDDSGELGGSQDSKLERRASTSDDSGEEISAEIQSGIERLELNTNSEERIDGIREVWRHNLRQEFETICRLLPQYPFVAMDTEFPGVVANPTENYDSEEYRYQQVKLNVDLLKLIQLGLTLFDSTGKLPEGTCTWQFNFEFNLAEDLYAAESISLLQNSGLDFEKHMTQGIPAHDFAELVFSSGLVLMDNVTWLTFHSAYDFGYLLSQLTQQKLPMTEAEFMADIKIYFPNIYDIKYLMLFTDNLIGGLQSVANYLKVKRIGTQHQVIIRDQNLKQCRFILRQQAGSDSLLTGQVFFRMYEDYFSESLDDVKYSGQIAGFKNALPTCGYMQKRELEDNILCAALDEIHSGSGIPSPMRDH